MARARKTTDKPARRKRPIEQYDHKDRIEADRGIESLKIIPLP